MFKFELKFGSHTIVKVYSASTHWDDLSCLFELYTLPSPVRLQIPNDSVSSKKKKKMNPIKKRITKVYLEILKFW